MPKPVLKSLARSLAVAVVASAAIVTTVRCMAQPAATQSSPLSTSLAPDMPADWFLHDSDAMAAPQRPLIGKPAPAIKVGRWFQHETDLSPAATKGNVVILDLWATWCVPCKADMPGTDALAKQYAGQGVVFVSLCADGEPSEVTDFIAQKKLDLPVAWDDDAAVYNSFAGQFFPTYVAIDKKGVVRAIGFKHEAMEPIVKMLLAEPAS